jgi:hypothetical protein
MHLGTISCCTHEFTAADIKPPIMTQKQAFGTYDGNLYGGNAQRFAKAVCPDCERSYLLWLQPKGGSYRVLTISVIESEKPAETVQIDVQTADKAQLKAYLKEKNVQFFNGLPEEKLRELVMETMAH